MRKGERKNKAVGQDISLSDPFQLEKVTSKLAPQSKSKLEPFTLGKVDRVLNIDKLSRLSEPSSITNPAAISPLRSLITPLGSPETKRVTIAISDLIPSSSPSKPVSSTPRYSRNPKRPTQTSRTTTTSATSTSGSATTKNYGRKSPTTEVTVLGSRPVKRSETSTRAASNPTKKGSASSNGFIPGPLDPQLPGVPSSTLLPIKLSPSRAKDFKQCPRLFFYKTILKLPSPGTVATVKGTLAHAVLEMIFLHPRQDRTKELASNYILPAWTVLRNPEADLSKVEDTYELNLRREWGAFLKDVPDSRATSRADDYLQIAPPGSQVESEILDGALAAVLGYFSLENPTAFDPLAREMPISGSVGQEPEGGQMHGIIDRLDSYLSNDGEDRIIISDYKTGKVPRDEYLEESFFAMRAYALLYKQSTGITPYSLRLLYVADAKGPASIITQKLNEQIIESTEKDLKKVWIDIRSAAKQERWETKSGPLCPWCPFQKICPEFNKVVSKVVELTPTLL